MRIHVTGPLKGTYSLAIVNRNFASALISAGVDVTLSTSEGRDLHHDPFFQQSGLLGLLVDRLDPHDAAFDVVTYNNWPIPDRAEGVSLSAMHCFAWEESLISPILAHRLSGHDLVTTTARSVSASLYHSGVTAALRTIGNGTDHIPLRTAGRLARDSFTFLHVSSCFDRKGVRDLVQAFMSEFGLQDSVKLVVKTFRNPHNAGLDAWLERERAWAPGAAEIEILYADLDPLAYYALMDQADCLVAPSYGEGFLIPAAEAFQRDLPVITTRWGGQADFCTNDNSWLVDGRFTPAKSHVAAPGSLWFSPDQGSLRAAMRNAFASSPELRTAKAGLGRRLLAREFKWSDTAERFLQAVEEVRHKSSVRTSYSIVSTWDQACGIATFTGEVVDSRPLDVDIMKIYSELLDGKDEVERHHNIVVERVWRRHSASLPALISRVNADPTTNIVVQHHPGILGWGFLGGLLAGLDDDKVITVHLHAARAGFSDLEVNAPKMGRARRFIVHNPDEYRLLVGLLGVGRVSLLPHGIDAPVTVRRPPQLGHLGEPRRLRLGAFGFSSPHKRYDLVIRAADLLVRRGYDVEIKLLSACNASNRGSVAHLKVVVELATALGLSERLTMRTAFSPIDDVISELATCDCIVFPYDEVQEGASGAVRVGIRAGVPVIVSKASLFDDLRDFVSSCREQDERSYANMIVHIVSDRAAHASALRRQADYISIASWQNVSRALFTTGL